MEPDEIAYNMRRVDDGPGWWWDVSDGNTLAYGRTLTLWGARRCIRRHIALMRQAAGR